MNTPVKYTSTQFSAKPQKGFTLIEALVAFLLLSVGMLGVGSLQIMSVKAGHTASFRNIAVVKVEEMLERIRNNPTQVLAYDSATTVATNNNCNDYSGSITPCTSANMVASDVYEWEQELIASLARPGSTTLADVGVTTLITVVPPVVGTQPLAVVTVTVNWQERNLDTNAMVTMNFSASADICTTTAC